MPGSKRTFTYTLVPAPEEADKVLAQATRIMGWACDGDPRITCHEVTGAALGVVTLSMTIHGRDQWWSTQLAQDILDLVMWGVENPAATRLDLQSQKQTPHEHRGYAHGRTKRYRERRKPHAAEGAENEFDDGPGAGSSTASAGT